MTESATLKILHTSDWHLGRQLGGRTLLEDQKHIINEILTIAETESCDALIIAGDLFDRSVPPADAVELLNRSIEDCIIDRNIPIIAISGNHDGRQRLNFGSRLLEERGLTIRTDLSRMLEPVELSRDGVVVRMYPLPYFEPQEAAEFLGSGTHEDTDDGTDVHANEDSQLPWHGEFDRSYSAVFTRIAENLDRSAVNILIGHCFAAGGQLSDSERSLSVGGSDAVSTAALAPFDYVALGHLHRPQSVGSDRIRYSGSPLPYSFSETGYKKSVEILEITSNGITDVRTVELSPLREMHTIEGNFDEIMAEAENDPRREDFIRVILNDRRPILDAAARIRTKYPNMLQLERSGLAVVDSDGAARSRDVLQRNTLDLFADFYRFVSGTELEADQESAVREVLNATGREEA